MEEHLVDLLGLAKLLRSCAIFGNLKKKMTFQIAEKRSDHHTTKIHFWTFFEGKKKEFE